MTGAPGFWISFLAFFGPQQPHTFVKFGPGLNVLYGASNTGKSFVVEAIDFMLGGKPPLRDVPERVGYDRAALGIETFDGRAFTIFRSLDGGSFQLYEGFRKSIPDEAPARVLAEAHNERNDSNLSTFLLHLCGLDGKRVRKNGRGETNSLSFRNIARLMIVNETEITQQRSPLSDGNVVADTANFSTFKLLLTGTDDSALAVAAQKPIEEVSRNAQLELLDQLLGEYRERLKELTSSPAELNEQLSKIDVSLSAHVEQLNATEVEFQQIASKRRELRKKLEEGRERRDEIDALLSRFFLLDQHYASDLERLEAIEEGGTLFIALGVESCPLCGAEPGHQRANADCDGNVDLVIAAARGEIAKIGVLRTELRATLSELRREAASFDRRLPAVKQELLMISSSVDRLTTPKLARLRASYAELSDKRGEVREALALYVTVQDMERRRADLERSVEKEKGAAVSAGDVSTAVADHFAQVVENILSSWSFPESGRVFFDSKSRDLVILGKARSAFGKGLRAVTHAAFTLGLLAFCRSRGTPHPGFVVLDSPLLAYREPEGDEVDLRGTDLQERFYEYLQNLTSDRQVIVAENTDPPENIRSLEQVQMFSKNPHAGRYGLFPVASLSA